MTKEEKLARKELKRQEKKEKRELEELYYQKKELNEQIQKEVHDIEKQKYIEKMTPIWEKRRKMNEAPHLSLLEEIGNAVSHGLGVIFTFVALILLLQKSDTPLKVLATVVYVVAMLFMFLNSTLYHSWKWGSKVKRIWRRFDYTSIYFLVAGTFAPLQLIELPKEFGEAGYIWGITYFGVMWAIVITGVTLTCVFGPGRVRKINFPLYFIVGWSGVSFIPGWIINNRFDLLWWILGGGIVYTMGMIPFGLLRGKKGAHFIWHLIVFLGVIAHFLGLYFCVY